MVLAFRLLMNIVYWVFMCEFQPRIIRVHTAHLIDTYESVSVGSKRKKQKKNKINKCIDMDIEIVVYRELPLQMQKHTHTQNDSYKPLDAKWNVNKLLFNMFI